MRNFTVSHCREFIKLVFTESLLKVKQQEITSRVYVSVHKLRWAAFLQQVKMKEALCCFPSGQWKYWKHQLYKSHLWHSHRAYCPQALNDKHWQWEDTISVLLTIQWDKHKLKGRGQLLQMGESEFVSQGWRLGELHFPKAPCRQTSAVISRWAFADTQMPQSRYWGISVTRSRFGLWDRTC